jgi:predicted glycosyltransferase
MITALIYVQHLLGIGHLVRAGALARGLEAAGIRVVLVSGGMPASLRGAMPTRFEQLPPVRAADESFKVLVDEAGKAVGESFEASRRERLLEIFDSERPDVIVTELYPFGRRRMRFELEALLQHARALRGKHGLPLIVSSVRDILVPPADANRVDEIVERVRRYYDLVLVHGDEELIPFRRSFDRAAEIADLTRSTGYVLGPVPARQGPGAPGYDEVIVSAGGGAVGEALMHAAIEARQLCSLRDRTWRVLVGQNFPEEAFHVRRAAAPRGVVVERARDDFTQLLANCALSISQGGYNTVSEILATATRAVCLPFAGGRESEQTLRCRILAERGLLQLVEADAVSAERVASAVERAMSSPPARGHAVDLGGAERSAALIREAVGLRRAPSS